jgi:CelD/BcsL family acetyltransferase involved in cellulose biosynthesis
VFSPGIDVEQIRADARLGEPLALVGEPSLCCVARQERAKGIDVLLHAFAIARRDLPGAGLTLVGPGLELEPNRALAKELGLADRVEFIERTDNAAPYLAAADVVALPSRREGLPVVALEALALERPLVATRVGGTPTVVVDGETGWLVPAEDENSLAAAIVASLRDPAEAARRARAGRRLVEERFSAGPMLDRIEARLAALAAKDPGRGPDGAPRPADGLHARVLTTESELDGVAAAWDGLRLEAEASPFLGPVLYRAWLDEFGQAAPLVVVVEDSAGRLLGVAPFVRRGPLAFSLPGRVKVTGELLVRQPEHAADVWRVVLQAVFARRSVQALMVPHATDDLAGVDGAKAVTDDLSLNWRSYPRFRRFFLGLEGATWESHHAGWSKNRRAHLRKARNKLDRRGHVEFREYPASEAYDVLREIHRRQWEARRSVSWVHLDAGARIDRRLIAEVPARILTLELDGTAIAATLWFDSGQRRIVLYLTRDPAITESSPGELLHAETVRCAFRDGVRELDFMGEGGNKQGYELEGHVGYELVIARSGLVGKTLLMLHALALRFRGRATSATPAGDEERRTKPSLVPERPQVPASSVATMSPKPTREIAHPDKQDAA